MTPELKKVVYTPPKRPGLIESRGFCPAATPGEIAWTRKMEYESENPRSIVGEELEKTRITRTYGKDSQQYDNFIESQHQKELEKISYISGQDQKPNP